MSGLLDFPLVNLQGMVLMCLWSRGRRQVQGEQNYNRAAKKRQCGESVACVTTYLAVQHLLFIVETQTHKRVTSAIKVNELRVNMEIFQNIGDSTDLQPCPTHRLKEALISCLRTM